MAVDIFVMVGPPAAPWVAGPAHAVLVPTCPIPGTDQSASWASPKEKPICGDDNAVWQSHTWLVLKRAQAENLSVLGLDPPGLALQALQVVWLVVVLGGSTILVFVSTGSLAVAELDDAGAPAAWLAASDHLVLGRVQGLLHDAVIECDVQHPVPELPSVALLNRHTAGRARVVARVLLLVDPCLVAVHPVRATVAEAKAALAAPSGVHRANGVPTEDAVQLEVAANELVNRSNSVLGQQALVVQPLQVLASLDPSSPVEHQVVQHVVDDLLVLGVLLLDPEGLGHLTGRHQDLEKVNWDTEVPSEHVHVDLHQLRHRDVFVPPNVTLDVAKHTVLLAEVVPRGLPIELIRGWSSTTRRRCLALDSLCDRSDVDAHRELRLAILALHVVQVSMVTATGTGRLGTHSTARGVGGHVHGTTGRIDTLGLANPPLLGAREHTASTLLDLVLGDDVSHVDQVVAVASVAVLVALGVESDVLQVVLLDRVVVRGVEPMVEPTLLDALLPVELVHDTVSRHVWKTSPALLAEELCVRRHEQKPVELLGEALDPVHVLAPGLEVPELLEHLVRLEDVDPLVPADIVLHHQSNPPNFVEVNQHEDVDRERLPNHRAHHLVDTWCVLSKLVRPHGVQSDHALQLGDGVAHRLVNPKSPHDPVQNLLVSRGLLGRQRLPNERQRWKVEDRVRDVQRSPSPRHERRSLDERLHDLHQLWRRLATPLQDSSDHNGVQRGELLHRLVRLVRLVVRQERTEDRWGLGDRTQKNVVTIQHRKLIRVQVNHPKP